MAGVARELEEGACLMHLSRAAGKRETLALKFSAWVGSVTDSRSCGSFGGGWRVVGWTVVGCDLEGGGL